MKIIGIYKIQSKVNPDKIYIGSSINIKNRWSNHLSELKANRHHSIKLQNHYNKYGKEDLEFSIIVGCSKEMLIAYEQFYIDSLIPWFNICPKAENCTGLKPSLASIKKRIDKIRGIPRDEETKLKIGKANKGQHRDDIFKLKMSILHKGKKETPELKSRLSKARIGSGNGNAKMVLNVNTGIFYHCCKDAHKTLSKSIEYSYFAQMLKNTHPNKTDFIYI